MAARDALGLSTKVVGVVSDAAPAYALSFSAQRVVEHEVSTRISDGMSCRTPHPDALAFILRGTDHIVRVTDDEVESAMRALFADSHTVAEGAGAAPLAALLQERNSLRGRKAGIVISGGNIDTVVYARVLRGPLA
jgi:threonine dehydratase